MSSQLRESLYGFMVREHDERRVPAEERKTYDIKGMWQRHHEIVNLAALGYKQVDIARILHIDPQTVSNTLNAQLGKEKLAEIRQSRDEETKVVVETINDLTRKALEVYHKIFDNEDGTATIKEQKEVADTVLMELSGFRVATKIQSQSVSTILSTTELNEFKRRGIEAARESGMLVETTAEEITGPNEVQTESNSCCNIDVDVDTNAES